MNINNDINNYKGQPPVLCVSGKKNSGKTALIDSLIPLLLKEGFCTAVIKHHGHGFGDEIPDTPGTDTYRFLASGAYGAVIYDDDMFSLVKRSPVSAADLVSLFPEADLVFIEGAKGEPWPRIAMLRAGQPFAYDPESLLCVVTDMEYDRASLPPGLLCFDFGDFEPVAKLVIDWLNGARGGT